MMTTPAISTKKLEDIKKDTLALILAGGKGTRLFELTAQRAKPSLMLGGTCRVIDFPIANCVNSGLNSIGILTQYEPNLLIQHIARNWRLAEKNKAPYIDILQSIHRSESGVYEGTAHAVYQNIDYIRQHNPKYVVILAGDHVYKMDYTDMLLQHVQNEADMTVSCIDVPCVQAANNFGVLQVDGKDQVLNFEEKPNHPSDLSDKPGFTLASMGNYIFNTDFLIQTLQADAKQSASSHDFGHDIIPSALRNAKVFAYRFNEKNTCPYWRDVGTIDSYWKANMDLVGEHPKLKLNDPTWPLLNTQNRRRKNRILYLTPKAPNHSIFEGSEMLNKHRISPKSTLRKSCLGDQVIVHDDAAICESVILPSAIIGKNAIINKAIVDEGCNIPDGMMIGVDHSLDRANGFRVSDHGVVLVTAKMLYQKAQSEKIDSAHLVADNQVTLDQLH